MNWYYRQIFFLTVSMSILLLGIVLYYPLNCRAEEETSAPITSKAELLKLWGLLPQQVWTAKGQTVPKGVAGTEKITTIADEGIERVAANYKILKTLRKAEMTLRFEYDSDRIEGEDSYRILDFCAEVLQEHPSVKAVVAGHADNTGDLRYNLDLSHRRAESVKRYLSHKIDPTRLVVAAFGEEEPLTTNATEDGRTLNRRVELIRYQ